MNDQVAVKTNGRDHGRPAGLMDDWNVGLSFRRAASRPFYRRDATCKVDNMWYVADRPTAAREDAEFYIPDFLSGEDVEPDSKRYAAAEDHVRNLRKAERCLDEALNLARVLRASMGEAGDSRAMQVETVLKIVEKRLSRAHAQIDKHDTNCMNLFMAYFDQQVKAGGSEWE